MKKSICVFLMWMLIFSFSSKAEGNIDIKIDAGFDGKGKIGTMMPVKIQVESKTNVDGNLKIQTENRVYHHPIQLSPNSKKEFFFSIPIWNGKEKIQASIEENGQILEEKSKNIKVLPTETAFIGILSDDFSNHYLKEYKDDVLLQNTQIVSLHKKLNDKDILNSISLIVIDNYNTKNLTNQQQNLLKNWISSGNTLFIETGERSYKTLTGIFSNLKEPTKVGKGFVVPIKNIKDAQSFEKTLYSHINDTFIEKIVKKDSMEERIQNSMNLYTVVDEMKKPNEKTALFLLIGLFMYLIILAIFIYIENKKWIFTITIFGFSILFYVLSWWGGFQKDEWMKASICVHDPIVRTYDLLYGSPAQKDPIQLKHDAFFIEGIDGQNYKIDPIEKNVNFPKKKEVECILYEEKNEGKQIGNISIEFIGKDKISANIENPIPETLENTFFVIGDSIIPIGNLEGKENKKIDITLKHELKNLGDYNYLEKIYEKAKLKEDQKEMFSYYFYNIEDPCSGKLIGFSNEKEEISINKKNKKIKNKICNVFPVNVNFKNKVHIPSGMIKPIFTSEMMERKEYLLENTPLEIYYSIPSEVLVEKIKLTTKQEGGEMKLMVYNFSIHQWELLTNTSFNKENLQNYIRKGFLKIKAEGDARMIIPQILLEGKIR
ncbi:hypothetical protein [Inediibacterium massiliense]|uniref:hypothetical protein n=1 Tax=Inediibacterium massiliense TaxID=1658111 RepID=UPI0006B47D9E|nr:hypothetical protein [Inediibacterium massiliense]